LGKTAQLAGDKEAYSKFLIEKYFKLVQDNRYDWRLRFRLAFAYYFGGYRHYAKSELRNISQIAPKNPWSYGYMAIISAEEKQMG